MARAHTGNNIDVLLLAEVLNEERLGGSSLPALESLNLSEHLSLNSVINNEKQHKNERYEKATEPDREQARWLINFIVAPSYHNKHSFSQGTKGFTEWQKGNYNGKEWDEVPEGYVSTIDYHKRMSQVRYCTEGRSLAPILCIHVCHLW